MIFAVLGILGQQVLFLGPGTPVIDALTSPRTNRVADRIHQRTVVTRNGRVANHQNRFLDR
jgi:hypothetical protein